MMGNPTTGRIMSQMGKSIDHYEMYFEARGIEYTQGYLDSFGPVGRWLTEQGLTREFTRYRGAKRALENLSSAPKEEVNPRKVKKH